MKILIACESSATVREAFKARGFDAWSCDIQPSDIPGQHIQGDAIAALKSADWDFVIAHPPCTYLTVTGNKWFKPEFKDRFPTRHQDREDAVNFFMEFTKAKRYAIENPVGIMSTRWRKPDQIVHPYHFGDPHSKATCLWLKGVPKLVPTNIVEPQFYTYKDGRRDPVWHVESMKLPPHERMRVRSKTWPGMAEAMAQQWGDHLIAEMAKPKLTVLDAALAQFEQPNRMPTDEEAALLDATRKEGERHWTTHLDVLAGRVLALEVRWLNSLLEASKKGRL